MAENELKVLITGDASSLSGTLDKVGGKIKGFSDKVAGIGKGMTIAGGIITAAVAGTFKTFTDYETKLVDMAKVTGESFDSIEEKISSLDPILGSQTELMSGYYQVISAGVKDPVEALNTLSIAAETANAAHVVQSEVVKGITKLMAGYEGEVSNAAEAADLLFSIEKEGQTSVAELIPVIGGLAKVSHDLGINQYEMAASMATITKTAGGTAEATTQYESILTGLMKPTEAMKEAFKAIGEEVRGIGEGYESAEEMIKDLGFVEALKKLKEHTGGSSQALAELFGRKEALLGFSAVSADSFGTLTETIKSVEKGAGSAAKAFDNWTKTSEAKIAELKNAFINFGKDIGDVLAEPIKKVIEQVSEIIKKIGEWAKKNPGLTEAIIKWGAAIGAVMVVLGPLLIALPGLVTLVGALLSPIGLVVIAAGLLYLAFTDWDKLVEIVGNIKDKVIAKIEEWAGAINKWWDNIVENTDNKWLLVADKIMKAVGKVVIWFASTIGKWIKDIIGWWGKIETDTDSIWNKIVNIIIDSAKAWIKFFADTLPGWILDIIAWWNKINDDADIMWENIKTTIISIVQNIWDSITFILEPIVKFVKGLWDSIKGDTSTIWGSIEGIISAAVNGIESVIGGMISVIKSAWETAKEIYNNIANIIDNAPIIGTGGTSISDIIESVQTPELPASITIPVPGVGGVPWYQHGTPYVPKTGLAVVHRGEKILPAWGNRGLENTIINVDIHDNRISDDVDIRNLATTVSEEILRKINLNRRH